MECQNNNRRKSLRLKNFNYSNAGAYFLTICSQDMRCIFGDVINGEMILNEAGQMVMDVWSEIPRNYPGFQLDEYILMPNHFHGVIWKTKSDVGVCPLAYPSEASVQTGQPRGVAPTSLFDVVYQFKSLTTNKYIKGVKYSIFPPFNKRLWQRNYYERIIRNEIELNNTRQYILDNPKNWKDDEYCL